MGKPRIEVKEHGSEERESVLPEEWVKTTIGHIACLENGDRGKNYPNKSALIAVGIPFINAGHLKDGEIDFENMGFISANRFNLLRSGKVRSGDILFCLRGSLGKCALVHNITKGAIASSLIIVRPTVANPKFVLAYFRSPLSAHMITKYDNGTAQPNLAGRDLNLFSIPLPPLAEQKEIAARLDNLLGQVETIKTRLNSIPGILTRFRQSVLTAAISGKLTKDWREENGEPDWNYRELNKFDIDIQIGPFGSLLHKSDYIENGIPLINPMHIMNGSLRPSTSMTVSESKAKQLQRYLLNPGDVVLGRRGEMGRAAVVEKEGYLCGTGSVFLRPNLSEFSPAFIALFLRSPSTIRSLESGAVGSTMVNLNQTILKTLEFPAVAKGEQTEIARQINGFFAFADQVEKRVAEAQEQVNKLTQSILAKAFRGELTADWRAANTELITGENSAQALLTRIKAERERIKALPKPRKPRNKRPGRKNMKKEIIPIEDALRKAKTPLSGQELLNQAGYPNDADTEQLERFFLDIRTQLDAGLVSCVREGDDDIFSLSADNEGD